VAVVSTCDIFRRKDVGSTTYDGFRSHVRLLWHPQKICTSGEKRSLMFSLIRLRGLTLMGLRLRWIYFSSRLFLRMGLLRCRSRLGRARRESRNLLGRLCCDILSSWVNCIGGSMVLLSSFFYLCFWSCWYCWHSKSGQTGIPCRDVSSKVFLIPQSNPLVLI